MNKTPTATCDHGIPLTDACSACAERLRAAAVRDDRGLVTGFDFSPMAADNDEPRRIEATVEIDGQRFRARLRPVPFSAARVDVDEWVESEDFGGRWLIVGTGDWICDGIADFTASPFSRSDKPPGLLDELARGLTAQVGGLPGFLVGDREDIGRAIAQGNARHWQRMAYLAERKRGYCAVLAYIVAFRRNLEIPVIYGPDPSRPMCRSSWFRADAWRGAMPPLEPSHFPPGMVSP